MGDGSTGGSTQQEDPWQPRGLSSRRSCLEGPNTALGPLPFEPGVSDSMGEGMARPSSSGFPGRLAAGGGGCAQSRSQRNEAAELDNSFHGKLLSSLALSSSMVPPPVMTPSPGVDAADRWRRDNVSVNNAHLVWRPPSVSVALNPRLENLERIVFGEGFSRVSGEPNPAGDSGNNNRFSGDHFFPPSTHGNTSAQSTIQTPQPGITGGSSCLIADARGSEGVAADHVETSDFSV